MTQKPTIDSYILAGIDAGNDLGDAVTLFRAVLGHKDASWEDRIGAHQQLFKAHNRWLLAVRIANQKHEETQDLHPCIGERYGRLTVVSHIGKDSRRRPLVTCTCDCGNSWQGRVDNLKQGKTVSCGCYRKEVSAENWRKP